MDPDDDTTASDPLIHPTEDKQSLAGTQQRVTSPRTSESVAEGTSESTAHGTIDDIESQATSTRENGSPDEGPSLDPNSEPSSTDTTDSEPSAWTPAGSRRRKGGAPTPPLPARSPKPRVAKGDKNISKGKGKRSKASCLGLSCLTPPSHRQESSSNDSSPGNNVVTTEGGILASVGLTPPTKRHTPPSNPFAVLNDSDAEASDHEDPKSQDFHQAKHE